MDRARKRKGVQRFLSGKFLPILIIHNQKKDRKRSICLPFMVFDFYLSFLLTEETALALVVTEGAHISGIELLLELS